MESAQREITTESERGQQTTRSVTDECLVLRNYDGDDTYSVDIEFRTPEGTVAYERTIQVDPLETISIRKRLPRRVYRVEVTLERGAYAAADVLVGSGVEETALIETGNRTVSVVEGFH